MDNVGTQALIHSQFYGVVLEIILLRNPKVHRPLPSAHDQFHKSQPIPHFDLDAYT